MTWQPSILDLPHTSDKPARPRKLLVMFASLVVGSVLAFFAAILAEIRAILPEIRIGLWYVDPLWDEEPTRHLRERARVLDGIFCSTGGPLS